MWSVINAVALSCACLLVLPAVEPLDAGSEILVYSDGLIDDLLDVAEAAVAKELKEQGIKINHRKKKGATFADALENCNKDMLKKEPDLIILALGMADLFDLRKDELLPDLDIQTSLANATQLINKIKNSNIPLIVCTPALFGEFPEQAAEANKQLDAFVAGLKQLCETASIECFDLRAASLTQIEKMKAEGKYKKNRPYLTKDGVKWSKEGAALLGNELQRYLGVNKSGIGRKIKSDDYVVFFLGHDYWMKQHFALMEKDIQKPFADQPGKPRLKPIIVSHQHYAGPQELPEISSQKASVIIYQVGNPEATHETLGLNKLPAAYEALMQAMLAATPDAFVMTPPLATENGTETYDPNGLIYKKTAQVAQIARDAAAKHGVPIIDIHAIMEAYHKEHPDEFLYGRNKEGGVVMSEKYKEIVIQESRKVVGLPLLDPWVDKPRLQE